jgi:hypothetical protein
MESRAFLLCLVFLLIYYLEQQRCGNVVGLPLFLLLRVVMIKVTMGGGGCGGGREHYRLLVAGWDGLDSSVSEIPW